MSINRKIMGHTDYNLISVNSKKEAHDFLLNSSEIKRNSNDNLWNFNVKKSIKIIMKSGESIGLNELENILYKYKFSKEESEYIDSKLKVNNFSLEMIKGFKSIEIKNYKSFNKEVRKLIPNRKEDAIYNIKKACESNVWIDKETIELCKKHGINIESIIDQSNKNLGNIFGVKFPKRQNIPRFRSKVISALQGEKFTIEKLTVNEIKISLLIALQMEKGLKSKKSFYFFLGILLAKINDLNPEQMQFIRSQHPRFDYEYNLVKALHAYKNDKKNFEKETKDLTESEYLCGQKALEYLYMKFPEIDRYSSSSSIQRELKKEFRGEFLPLLVLILGNKQSAIEFTRKLFGSRNHNYPLLMGYHSQLMSNYELTKEDPKVNANYNQEIRNYLNHSQASCAVSLLMEASTKHLWIDKSTINLFNEKNINPERFMKEGDKEMENLFGLEKELPKGIDNFDLYLEDTLGRYISENKGGYKEYSFSQGKQIDYGFDPSEAAKSHEEKAKIAFLLALKYEKGAKSHEKTLYCLRHLLIANFASKHDRGFGYKLFTQRQRDFIVSMYPSFEREFSSLHQELDILLHH